MSMLNTKNFATVNCDCMLILTFTSLVTLCNKAPKSGRKSRVYSELLIWTFVKTKRCVSNLYKKVKSLSFSSTVDIYKNKLKCYL